jgi:DNA-binding MarR family transcriptional regulator
MAGSNDFRFRDSEVEEVKLLLGAFGLLAHRQQQSELLARLVKAGMVTEEPFLDDEDLRCYWLTPEAKAAIHKALG